MFDSSFGWRFVNKKLHEMYGTVAMDVTAENLAELYNISGMDQDTSAFHSHQKAFRAQQNGLLAEEIIGVGIADRKVNVAVFKDDEFIKGNTTIDDLSKLKTHFKKVEGTVSAGNSSGLNDGAAAMLVASEDAIKNFTLTSKARIACSAVVGVEPWIMGIGLVGASQNALRNAGLTLDQMDVAEFNEALAAQCLTVTRNLGLSDNDERVNPNGGAIALEHPLGMSGTRIVHAATNELVRTKKKYALAAMCVGVGMGYAMVVENVFNSR
jgi:acetyl-CoA acetyltransferase family protein